MYRYVLYLLVEDINKRIYSYQIISSDRITDTVHRVSVPRVAFSSWDSGESPYVCLPQVAYHRPKGWTQVIALGRCVQGCHG